MGKPFDIKTYEQLERRKVVLRNYAQLPHSAQEALLQILAAEVTRTKIFKTCVTCNKFEVLEPTDGAGETIERCKLTNTRPPAVVIADGCELYAEGYYDDHDIPF